MICIQKKKVFEVNYEDFSQNFVRNFYLNNYDNLKVVIIVKKKTRHFMQAFLLKKSVHFLEKMLLHSSLKKK